jgi:diaminopimelate epimerase
LIRKVCQRKLSVGADGLILIEKSEDVDFKWRFFNSDGSLAEMCGNGARCAARFAYLNGIAGEKMRFATAAGVIAAEVTGEQVKIGMTDPFDMQTGRRIEVSGQSIRLSHINTGVPHAVIWVEDLEAAAVAALGREIRFHPAFAPAGTNVNFVSLRDKGALKVRTYERGVEDETLACGTGAVASALMAAAEKGYGSPVNVQTRSGGVLTIYFKQDDTGFNHVYMEGDARVIYQGKMWTDAWNW